MSILSRPSVFTMFKGILETIILNSIVFCLIMVALQGALKSKQ